MGDCDHANYSWAEHSTTSPPYFRERRISEVVCYEYTLGIVPVYGYANELHRSVCDVAKDNGQNLRRNGGVMCFQDDVVISGRNEEEHWKRLSETLKG